MLLFVFALNSWADVRVQERTFTFRIRDEFETLDWNRAHTPVEAYILMNLMEGLVTFEHGLTPTPALAKSWTISPDGKTYTFKLRNDVHWSDGVPLRAQDFVYSWRRLLAPFTGAPYSYILYDIEGAEEFGTAKISDFSKVGISAPDDFTFVVKLKYPLPYWIDIPAFWVTFPLRQDIVEKYGTSWATPGRMVTVGPYNLISHDSNSNVMIKKNAYYYGPRGNVDKIIALMIQNDRTAFEMYEKGQIDLLTDLGGLDKTVLAKRTDLKVFTNLKTAYLTFLPDQFPTSNIHVRKAIAQGINKAELVKSLSSGLTPATSFVPPPLMGYSKTLGLSYDLKKAGSELDLSGLKAPGSPIQVRMLYANWDKDQAISEFIRNDLKKNLDIDLQIKGLDNRSFRNQLDLKTHPLFLTTWTADFPDPDNFLSIFLTGSGNGRTSWTNETFDKDVMAARISLDPKQRRMTYDKLQKQLLEDEVVIIPLYYEPNLVLIRPSVRDFKLSPMDYLYLRNINVGQ